MSFRPLAFLTVAALALSGCGGGDEVSEPPAPASAAHPPVTSPAPGEGDPGPTRSRGPVQLRAVAEYDVDDPACVADPAPTREAPAAREVTLCDLRGLAHRLDPAATVSGVESAEAGMPEDSTSWTVSIELDRKGAAGLEDLTRDVAGTGQQIAIVHGGRVLSAPTIEGVITNGQLQVAGSFSAAEAEQLAAGLSRK